MQPVMSTTFVYLLSIVFTVVQFTTADFDLYRVDSDWSRLGWALFDMDAEPGTAGSTCDDVNNHAFYPGKNDLSTAVWSSWPDVNIVEMHFVNKPLYHWTIYKDDGYVRDNGWKWWLWGVDGHNYGECFAYEGHDVDCYDAKSNGHVYYNCKFRCNVRDPTITAKAINAAYWKDTGYKPPNTKKSLSNGAVGNATAIAWTN
ncbi:hypothetical protein DPSP01_008596 [Paraphaeosphaeria sporulosa]|uniref:Uncharacterized protein n=1 Tax=Paraphaeosphaeria sporulosa TaxID=1460663 RepID=A0A177BVC1_9PLEO|nr:uncharacterized protein CC84DRAFT_1210234 [Paraphaeosphaeria sporulosa]OAF99342.1 hypothetical protein CC84DRAFT_1210234 [Paraphaeosphaeria sporulosa]